MNDGSTPRRSVVIHGHFYQPPREEPWLELITREPGAAPFHDWNQRIEHECYRAVVAARVQAADGRIARIVNTLDRISFNIGPTLIEWLERAAPDTWYAMVAADRASALRLGGHGNALAMPFHHSILPLASRRDKTTEVRWGIADFRRRFSREPEGMWLPETAVDDETLDVLASEGIKFTVLAPHQVQVPPPDGLPGKYTTSSGRTIALFLYDGPMSQDVAFGSLTRDGAGWANRLLGLPQPASGPMLTSVATDGETYGHHHRFGEMALATMLERLALSGETRVENFGSFLARHPAEHPVHLVEPSSWSCPHGVERWKSNCGCRLKEGTSQAWRAPMREGLNELAERLHAQFAEEAAQFFPDAWAARDAYAALGTPSHLPVRARELLEMERNALRMFTSCGWFYDDIAGIESLVCLRYAARAIELAGPEGAPLGTALRAQLALAPSNDPSAGSGRDVYDRKARPSHPGEVRAAAGYAAVLAVAPEAVRSRVGAYVVGPGEGDGLEVRHRRTGRSWNISTAVHRTSHVSLAVELRLQGESALHTVDLDQLPEPEREKVHLALRRELRQAVLGAEEERRISEGTLRFERAIGNSLIAQLPTDPAQAVGLDVDRLGQTLDLLTLEGQIVPFDAQSRFYRIWTEGPKEASRLVAPLAYRFGFDGEVNGSA